MVDSSIRDPGLVELLQEIRPSISNAGVIVVTERQLALGSLIELIDLDVRVVMEKPLEEDIFQQKLAQATYHMKRALDSGHKVKEALP